MLLYISILTLNIYQIIVKLLYFKQYSMRLLNKYNSNKKKKYKVIFINLLTDSVKA